MLVLGAGVYAPIEGCESAGTTDMIFLLALDADGACLWMKTAERLPLAFDPSNSAIEAARIAVSPEGHLVWVATANQSFRFDGMVLDATPTPAADFDDSTAFVIGTTASGSVRFVHRVDTAGPDAANGVAIEADGDIYAALRVWQGDTDLGDTISSRFESIGMVVALTSDGTLRWQRDATDTVSAAKGIAVHGHDVLTISDVAAPNYPVRMTETAPSP